jgi:prevent-host-death family protein
MNSMKKIVGCFEAKTNFNRIINNVINGEEILVTKRGKPVAKIIPIDKSINFERVNNAFLRLDNLAKEMNLGKFNWEEFKSYRDEGKK